jgi:thiamine biosynthesis protein ThiS
MKIHIQGEPRETAAATVEALLAELNLLPSEVAVEHNGIVLFRHEMGRTPIKDGDRIEIIRVVAGG